jgi:plasmid stabilization system protein ParE
MKYQLSVRDLAEQDMTEAYDFYEAEESGLGDRFHDEVASFLRKIQNNPRQYPISEKLGYYKAALSVFPFCIYYQIIPGKIIIIAVHHARSDPQRWQSVKP